MEHHRSSALDEGCLSRMPSHDPLKNEDNKENTVPQSAKCIPTITIFACGHGSQRIAHMTCNGAPPRQRYCNNMATNPRVRHEQLKKEQEAVGCPKGLKPSPEQSRAFKSSPSIATPIRIPAWVHEVVKGAREEDEWDNVDDEKDVEASGLEDGEEWVLDMN
ncbi:uncharacterized protein PAC_16139 [Phialocephala subalpina]|uniref:Uncharacterized protein n=1 Tax=Phialocephala subalpina TaxID=576137 RepID=A0A1L7XMI5_9HELO|nr:uncharacterized protein PAC_16139 [Phialocephala subalpina]